MDRQLGGLFEAMKTTGLDKNTIVIFTSDNSPKDIEIRSAQWCAAGSSGPLRGRKRSIYEGGVRVPWIMKWPARIPAGRVNDTTAINAVDLCPSLSKLARAKIPEATAVYFTAEGYGEEALSSVFSPDQSIRRKKPMFWEWSEEVVNHPWNGPPMLAIRDGDWKLLLNPDRSRVELYNIPQDPGEIDNLAAAHPEITERLAAAALAWQVTLPQGRIDPQAGKNDYLWPGKKP